MSNKTTGFPRWPFLGVVLLVLALVAAGIGLANRNIATEPPGGSYDRRREALENLYKVTQDFRKDVDSVQEDPRAFGRELDKLKQAISGASAAAKDVIEVEQCSLAFKDLEAKNEYIKSIEDLAQEPEKPEKPKLSDFQEVRRMCAQNRARFVSEDGSGIGIVVIAHGEYYVIMDAAPSLFSNLCGYVTEIGGSVTLDNGHSAAVLKLSDEVEYREDLKQAKESYAEALVKYRDDLKKWQNAKTPSGREKIADAQKVMADAKISRANYVNKVACACASDC